MSTTTCPYIERGDEGTTFCRLAADDAYLRGQLAAEVRRLNEEIDRHAELGRDIPGTIVQSAQRLVDLVDRQPGAAS